jgi:anti-sigma factor (TIGR02949 family)
MDCRHELHELYRFLDREMLPEEEVEFANHMTVCLECLKRYGFEWQFQQLVVRRMQQEEVPEDLMAKVKGALRLI